MGLLRETANELRGLQFRLSPPLLHREGLTPALYWLASHATERFGVVVSGPDGTLALVRIPLDTTQDANGASGTADEV